MLQLSVIIPNYNRADALEQTLAALAKQTVPPETYEVIVVDDGSTDASIPLLQNISTSYSLILIQQSNGGAGAARNRGVCQAQSELLVFLDSDMIAAPGLLQQYLTASAQHPQALILGRQQPWPSAYQTLFDKATRYEWFRDLGSDFFSPTFYHVLSSSMAISRGNFEKVGGFDEGVGTGAHPATDDTDFGYRAQRMGIKLVYWPDALAYHNHPRTLQQRCRQEYSTAMWTARMFQRYPEMQSLIPVFGEIQPICWQHDPLILITRKIARQILALKPVVSTIRHLSQLTETWWPNLPLLCFLYWKILSAYRVTGYREGMKSN